MRCLIFDLTTIQKSGKVRFHGGGEYSKTILYHLCGRQTSEFHIVVAAIRDEKIEQWLLNRIQETNAEICYVDERKEIINIFQDKNDRNVQLLYFNGNVTDQDMEMKMPRKVCYIGTYHGLRWIELQPKDNYWLYKKRAIGVFRARFEYIFRNYKQKKDYNKFRKILARYDYLIGDSMHSHFSAQSLYHKEFDEKLLLFYPPMKKTKEFDDRIKKNTSDEKYVLMINANRPEKNIVSGVMAMDQLFTEKRMERYRVVVVGGLSKYAERRIQNKKRFKLLDYVDSDILEKLYKECDIFLYPTWNEGFGYPPLEAMKYGKTCVISAVSSLTEVFQNAVYYINPYDINEIKARLLQASEFKIQKDLIKQNYDRIVNKQEQDLERLCAFLCEGEIRFH